MFGVFLVSSVMSGRVKTRAGGSNAALEQATLSINERILKECHTLYTEPDKGTIPNTLVLLWVCSSLISPYASDFQY